VSRVGSRKLNLSGDFDIELVLTGLHVPIRYQRKVETFGGDTLVHGTFAGRSKHTSLAAFPF
jgi:hypothetical protein